MDKKFFILLTSLLLLTGCCNSVPDNKQHPNNQTTQKRTTRKQTFVVIEKSYRHGSKRVIVRDTETNVLYVDCYYGIVPLLNSDGTPKLYKNNP
jgi:starvation-inducible outer membrane lipoprotein